MGRIDTGSTSIGHGNTQPIFSNQGCPLLNLATILD